MKTLFLALALVIASLAVGAAFGIRIQADIDSAVQKLHAVHNTNTD